MNQPMAMENMLWRQEAEHAIKTEAATGRVFDAYELQERYKLTAPAHTNEWGSLFRAAATKGIIQPIGFHKSRRPSRASGVCRVWAGSPTQQGSGPGVRQDMTRTAERFTTKHNKEI